MTKTTAAPQKTRLQSGLSAGAMVMTLTGPRPVEALQPGERIVTRQGARILRAVRMNQTEAARAVTIRASALGHDRPDADITVAAGQPILLRDWRARALYGQDVAAVPASRLVDGEYITSRNVSELRTFDLIFDAPEVIYVEGTEFPMACALKAEPDAG